MNQRCFSEYCLDAISFAIGIFSTSRNGNHHVKTTPEDTVTLRPPIKEHTTPESATSEVSKMGRPFCTVEEVRWVRKLAFEITQFSSHIRAMTTLK